MASAGIGDDTKNVAGHIAAKIAFEGKPVHTTRVTLQSPDSRPLEGFRARIQGDQLFVSSTHFQELQLSLLFGVDRKRVRGELSDKCIRLVLPYAPLHVWLGVVRPSLITCKLSAWSRATASTQNSKQSCIESSDCKVLTRKYTSLP